MPFGDFKDKTRHAAVVETRRAVRWLRSQTWLPVDEDAIFALGTSAGGFVANEALIAPQTDFTTDLPGQTIDPANHPGVPHDIAAAVDLWGKTLTDNVDGNDPPVLIIHGTADTVVDFSYSQDLADAAAFAGMPHDFVPLPGEDHGPFDVLIDGLTIAEYSMDFLADSIPVPEPRQDVAVLLGVVVVAQLRRVRQSRASARR